MLRRISLLLLLIFFSFTVFAQVSAPSRDQTQAAVLADMSRRTGETVTLNSLGYQQWHYGTYDYVRSLGCPASPQTPPTTGNWQRFVFNYRGFDYIYLVSDNLQSLILCNEAALPTAIAATVQPTATQQGTGQSGGGVAASATPILPTATLQGSGQSGGGFAASATPAVIIIDAGNLPTPYSNICLLSPRIYAGGYGRVTPGDANWLHFEPSRDSTKIGEVPAGAVFSVIAGPVCDEETQMSYWQIDYNGLVGWTSEGLNGEYWLEPYQIGFWPENIAEVFVPDWATTISNEENALISLSPDSDRLAISRGNLVEVFRTDDNSKLGELTYDSPITSIEFAHSASLFVGTETGLLQELSLYAPFTVLMESVHEGGITAIAVAPNRIIVAVADEARILTFWSLLSREAPMRRIELPEVAGDLEFSGNPALLIVRDTEGNFLTALQAPNPQ